MRTYKDTLENRKLKRVGKTYGKGMASSTRSKAKIKCFTKAKDKGGTYTTCIRNGSNLTKK
jgi:hypothetical protein|tara:strand:+ start:87 stop:269 length:183 start_codon:yes stop_codon:yes gene_type:complete